MSAGHWLHLCRRTCQTSYPATISDFRLDRCEITVGRFRKFVEGYPGYRPMANAGMHPFGHLNRSGVEFIGSPWWKRAGAPAPRTVFTLQTFATAKPRPRFWLLGLSAKHKAPRCAAALSATFLSSNEREAFIAMPQCHILQFQLLLIDREPQLGIPLQQISKRDYCLQTRQRSPKAIMDAQPKADENPRRGQTNAATLGPHGPRVLLSRKKTKAELPKIRIGPNFLRVLLLLRFRKHTQ